MTDFPRIRATNTCPRCSDYKDRGLVICWSCNHQLKRMYIDDPTVGDWGPWEGKLAVIEGGLEARHNHE